MPTEPYLRVVEGGPGPTWSGPYIVKPVWEDASEGISADNVVQRASDIPRVARAPRAPGASS